MKKSASALELALPNMLQYFERFAHEVFRYSDLNEVLRDQRDAWGIAPSVSVNKLINILLERRVLVSHEFEFPLRPETRYTRPNSPLVPILMSLNRKAYASHYTAVYIHGLTEQVPKTIYLNAEQSPKPRPVGPLVQKNIDHAFRRKQRVTNNTARYGDLNITMMNGMYTNNLAVELKSCSDIQTSDTVKIRTTNIVRTLIDIAVRPVYAGGISQVAESFALAHGRFVVADLFRLLQELNYVYPYHQSIGYYLEKSGKYESAEVALFRTMPMQYDFYLTYGMQRPVYRPDWRLYTPEWF